MEILVLQIIEQCCDGGSSKVISEYSWDGTTEQISRVSYYSALTTDGIDQTTTETVIQGPRKYIRDGRLVIRQADGHEYNLNGVRVK